jgi:CelD/BcsL family acetyltransferase involved in cellulose biosynthesis
MPDITLSAVRDMARLGSSWQALEARSRSSFFQSWAWVGCRAAQRFPDPVLLTARAAGEVVALGLFNRVRPGARHLARHLARHGARHGAWGGAWFLGESGRADLDSVFVEHSGLLVADGWRSPGFIAACLRVCLAGVVPGRLVVLSGVDALHAAAAREAGAVWPRMERAAPSLDLAALRAAGGDYLAGRSANTRQQLRRSARAYAAFGPLAARRAATVAEAHDFLDRLAVLHQATWRARGRPGAFAAPAFAAFHHELIARAFPQGGIDLLRVAAGDAVLGYLYNIRSRDRVCAYQSGFDYEAAGPACKPGLTCHHVAIEMYRADPGVAVYDFLAGPDRYKTSLADGAETLHWLTLAPARSLWGAAFRARGWLHCRLS